MSVHPTTRPDRCTVLGWRRLSTRSCWPRHVEPGKLEHQNDRTGRLTPVNETGFRPFSLKKQRALLVRHRKMRAAAALMPLMAMWCVAYTAGDPVGIIVGEPGTGLNAGVQTSCSDRKTVRPCSFVVILTCY